METRTEHDSLGDVEVPLDALWKAQTQRAFRQTRNLPQQQFHDKTVPA